jgi:hypothetical protein
VINATAMQLTIKISGHSLCTSGGEETKNLQKLCTVVKQRGDHNSNWLCCHLQTFVPSNY